MWYISASMISPSTNSRRRFRLSTTVTREPRVANMQAYSIPITPAPTTIIVAGTLLSSKMPSASMMADPSTGTS
jgi:hypothetical protein